MKMLFFLKKVPLFRKNMHHYVCYTLLSSGYTNDNIFLLNNVFGVSGNDCCFLLYMINLIFYI